MIVCWRRVNGRRCMRELVEIAPGRWGHLSNPCADHHYPKPRLLPGVPS